MEERNSRSHELYLSKPLLSNDEKQQGLAHKVEEGEWINRDEQRGDQRTTSFFKTCFHGVNALSGLGILSTPYALASGGWLSLVLLLSIAIAAFYSGLLIKRCMDAGSNIGTYPDIGKLAFGNKGRVVVLVLMCVELFLVATGFLILEGDNLQNLFPNLGFDMGGLISRKQSLVLIVTLIILPSVWLDNLNILSYISASGVLASGIILVSILWTGAFDGIGFHQKGTLINWSGIPTAVSLYCFCYCAHPVFPKLYTSMRKKHQFSNVLLVCFILCTVGYASIAAIGYLMFGEEVESQITLNLPLGKLSSRVAIYTTLAIPICKYALVVTPIIDAIEECFPGHCNRRPFRLLISTVLCIGTVIVALTVPFFGYLMSLVGAFLSVTASIIIPCICYLKISGTYRTFGCETITIWAIILVGTAIAIFGTYTSLRDIVHHL